MTASYGAVMANISSKTEARKKVREAQACANEARLQRERENVDDAASFLVELGRLTPASSAIAVSEVGAVLKSAGAQTVAPPDALGAPLPVSVGGSA